MAMLKKEINNIQLSASNPYEIKLVNVEPGSYRFRIIHQNKAVFERSKSLFLSFGIEGYQPEEVKEILGLNSISPKFGAFTYIGGGDEKSGYYVKEVVLVVKNNIDLIVIGVNTFLQVNDILLDLILIDDVSLNPSNMGINISQDKELINDSGTNKLDVNYIDNNISILYQLPKNITLLKDEKYIFEVELSDLNDFQLSVECISVNNSNKGVVANIVFYDYANNVIKQPYEGMSRSKAFNSYFYILVDNKNIVRTYPITPPINAVRVRVELVNFLITEGVTFTYNTKLSSNFSIGSNNPTGYYLKRFEKIVEEAKTIPDSNGSRFYEKIDLNVGVIADEYMFNFYKDVFKNTYYLSPSNYEKALTEELDLVIYTTCWKGRFDNEWQGVKFREKPKLALDNILQFAKSNNIKTVFQTIEDPSNFDYFLPVAEKFDYVFTTDTDCIEAYKDKLGHNNVFYGEYGVNPQFNNPIGSRRHIRNAAFFAGSYPKRYLERCTDMEIVFDSILEATDELYIADRNYFESSKELEFPNKYKSHLLPPVEHNILQKIHKLFRYNLNFNSIKNSPTMCAMRVYELQAQGVGIISNYAKSVFNKFPGIRIIPYPQDLSLDFEDFSLEEYQNNINNLREILSTKTSYQVVGDLVKNIGFEIDCNSKKQRTIAIIYENKSDLIFESYKKQNYPNKVLINAKDLDNWDSLKVNHNIGYFTWFKEDFNYEENYLTDFINAFKYTDCDFITKNSYFDTMGNWIKGVEHEYTELVLGKELTVFSCQSYKPTDFTHLKSCERIYLPNGYSIDPFELNYNLYRKVNIKEEEKSYKLSVIVPVFNNGKFLLKKCLPSLMRNKIWLDMEVLLIDDGSTDLETITIINTLTTQYSNIYSYFYPRGGSGSASRPRNKGMEIATAPLLSFLDPDNEISSGGYDQLVELFYEANKAEDLSVDFISGYHVKVDNEVKAIGRHTQKRLSIITDLRGNYFDKGRFPVLATQSAVISKSFIKEHNICFVENSAGQDTLFGWEILVNSTCGGFTNEVYIIYYADRYDSVTNTIDLDYFEKKLILEKSQIKFLKDNNLISIYINAHFDQFMKNWYIPKLNQVKSKDYLVAKNILKEICAIYGVDTSNYFSDM